MILLPPFCSFLCWSYRLQGQCSHFQPFALLKTLVCFRLCSSFLLGKETMRGQLFHDYCWSPDPCTSLPTFDVIGFGRAFVLRSGFCLSSLLLAHNGLIIVLFVLLLSPTLPDVSVSSTSTRLYLSAGICSATAADIVVVVVVINLDSHCSDKIALRVKRSVTPTRSAVSARYS